MRAGPRDGNTRRGRRLPQAREALLPRLRQPLEGLQPERCDSGQALPAADAVPAGLTTGADNILRNQGDLSSFAGTRAARRHALQPRPPLAFRVHVLLFVNIWHQWTPLQRNIWELTDAHERRLSAPPSSFPGPHTSFVEIRKSVFVDPKERSTRLL